MTLQQIAEKIAAKYTRFWLIVAQPSGKSTLEMKLGFFRCEELKFGTDVTQGVLS